MRSARFYQRWQTKLRRPTTRRRAVRISLLASNVIILAVVIGFIVQNNQQSTAVAKPQPLDSAAAASSVASPLDQLASANIAVTVARVASLPETNAVTSEAESENIDLALSSVDSQNVIAKPQVVTTALKSRADIQHYTSVAGDTVSGLASKFGVTSSSIRWSNSLGSSDTIPVNTKLTIPPVNGIVYTVKAGDTTASLAQKFATQEAQIIAFNDAEISGIQAGEEIIIPGGSVTAPVTAAVSFGGGGFSFGTAAIYGSNGYDPGWCTWYAANRRAQLGRPIPSNLGNARSWYRAAILAGLPTGSAPEDGAVMVNQAGDHVAVVEQVNDDGSFWISEMNAGGQVSITNPAHAGGFYRVDYRLVPSVGDLKFIY